MLWIVRERYALSVTGVEPKRATAAAIDTALTHGTAQPAPTAVFCVVRRKNAALAALLLLRQRATAGPGIARETRGTRGSAAATVKGVRRQIDAQLAAGGLPHGTRRHAHAVIAEAANRARDSALTAMSWIRIERDTRVITGG
jgi:hypothetical protein